MSSSEKTFSILVGVAGLTAISLFIVMVAQPIKGQAFSEFYISKPHDVLANNPYSMALGDTLNLTLVVENHENQAVSYKVDILFNDVKIQSITYGNLKDKAVWSKNITLSPSIPGNNQKVEFQLYKNNDSTPYSTLRLWLAVTE